MDARMVVHADNFVTQGHDGTPSEIEKAPHSRYTFEVKAILGKGRNDTNEVRILNRRVRWNAEYAPDPRNAHLIVKKLQLENTMCEGTPKSQESNGGGDVNVSIVGSVKNGSVSQCGHEGCTLVATTVLMCRSPR